MAEQETSAKEDDTPRPLRAESTRSAESEKEESSSANSSLLDVIHTLYTKGKEYASKIFQRSFFDVVETPEFMKQYGLTGSKFTIRYGVITRHWGKDESHNLTEQEWSKLPEALRNPFAITKLKDEESGYRIYTSLQNAKGEYVVVGVDVKNAGRDIEVNAISTVFGRKTDAGLTTNEEVVYRSEKITPEQSSLLGQPNSDQYPTEQESSSASEDKQTSEENKTSFADEMLADTLSNAPEELKGRITVRESSTGDEQEENFVQSYDIDGKPSGISRIELFDAKSNENPTRFVIDGSDVDAASSEQDKWESLAREYHKTHPDVKLYIGDESGIGFSTFKDAYEFRNWAETRQQETSGTSEAKQEAKSENEKSHKAEGRTSAVSQVSNKALGIKDPAQQLAFEAVSQMLSDAGIPVEQVSNETMRQMAEGAEKKGEALETVSSQNGDQQTVISSASGANVLKNLDILHDSLENAEKTEEKTFLGRLAMALGAKRQGSDSQYATFETMNGRIVTIRLANHNATVSTFDNRGEEDGISLVVSAKENSGIDNDGKTHLVEFYYDAIKLRKAEGKPLADIVSSIKQALYSGEYKDTTGLAQVEEVNAENTPEFMTVYHGSGAKFDKFDSAFMGTGEGAQAYGWGHYVTEVEGIGRTYAKENPGKTEYSDLEREEAQAEIAGKVLEKYGIVDSELLLEYDGAGGFYEFEVPQDKETLEHLMQYFKEHEDEFGWYSTDDFNLDDKGSREEFASVAKDVMLGYAKEVAGNYDYLWDTGEQRILYTIDIPEDNGHNYLSYDETVPKEEVKSVLNTLYAHLVADEESGYSDKAASKELRKELDSLAEDEIDGNNLYGTVSSYLGTDKEASEFLGGIGYAGLKYPTNFKSGGNAEGTNNYVIFKDSDLKIVDRVEFLRDGAVVYGAAVGGKIYLNAERLNPNTPIHEYTHLWDKACKAKNPELWKRGVELMKQTSVWKEVENDPNYKGLDEDGIASEVHSRLTGKDGAALLERMSKEALESKGVLKAADKMTVIENLKKWLSDFWYWIKDTMTAWSRSEAEKVSLEDFVNMPISDLAKGTRLRDEEDSIRFQENEDIRYQFVGEQGAENADRAEEVTTRLDNLSVAREMEEQKKDAKSIKMATGWERGADGKWRYEIPDAKIKDTIEIGGRSEKRFEEDMLWADGKLGDSVDAPELFKAYPQLKDITIHTDAVTNDMPSNGEYDANTKTITIHATKLKYLNSILNHEIQHAIQDIEGFARGGSSEQMAREFNAAKTEWKARAYAKMLSETSKGLGGEENRSKLDSAVAKEYEEAGMTELLPDESTRALGYNYFARGYADSSIDDAIRRFGLEESTRADFNPSLEYKKLAGEVEARNVQSRMDLTDAERRNTLAVDTEDVSREDQIFLYGNGVSESRTVFGGNSGYVGYSMSRRAAQAREDGKFPKTDFKKEYKVKEDSLKALVDAKVIDDSEWHHTSMYGNRTTFYQWDEPEYADIYAENKKEIDAMIANKEKDLKSKIANLQEQLDAMPKERPYRYEMESDEFRNAKRRIERETSAKTQEINDSYPDNETKEQRAERISRLEAAWAEREARIKELEENASESDKVIIAHSKANDEYYRKSGKLVAAIQDARRDHDDEFRKKLSDYFISRYEAIEAQRKAEAEAKAKLDAVNEQFNGKLDSLIADPTQKDRVLSLGQPGNFLVRGGIADAEIRLDYDKLVRKSKESYKNAHPFDSSDVKNLPRAINAPIAVFNNTNDLDAGQVILTEIKRGDHNFIVAVQTKQEHRKGGVIIEVNDISTLFPKNAKGIINWFIQGKATNIDKEKALHFIEALPNHLETTITSEELSSATKVVESFENPTVAEKNVADEDNTIQYSIVDEGMPDSGSSEATEILDDVKSNGLSARMSEEQSDDLLLDLYQDVSESTRRKVTDRAMKNGFSFPKAMASYIADMDTDNLSNEDKACLTKARDAIKKGLLIDTGNTNSGLSLKDTQWIMYQTAHAGERGIFAEADRIENAERLGHTEADEAERRQLDNGVIVDRADEQISDDAAGMYNKSVSYWLNRLKEGFVDQFEAVNALVEAIEKATGSMVNTFEDIRLALNQQSSKGFARMNAYMRDFYGPLLDTIRDLVKNGKVSYEEIVRYVMLKHAIERNHVFAMRDAKEHYKSKHDAKVKELRQARAEAEKELADATAAGDQELIDKKQYALDKIDERINNADAALVEAEKRIEDGTDSVYLEFRENDYGGLTSMFSEYPGLESRDKYKTDAEYNAAARAVRKPKYDNVADMEAAAAEEVERFESNPDANTDELWQRINAATKETLRSQYMSGMLSKEQYEAVSGMFEYYVPLRGFSDTTGEDIWDYYTAPKTGSFAPAIIGAKGRKTEADNPFNWIGTMASSAIASNVKNESKLALYYLVLNRPEQNLVMTGESWYKFDTEATAKYRAEHPDSNKRVFIPAVPPSMDGMDSETAMQTYNAWQASMRDLEKKGEAINEKNRLDASKDVAFIDDRQKSEHVIRLKIGGVEHSLIINGSPRAAQAINGLLNMETSSFQQHFGWVLRGMSALNTSLNPEFWISNLQRDLLFAMMSMDVNGNEISTFVKNLVNPFKLERMAKAYEEGALGDSEIEKYYREFCDNGAVTGFTVVNNNDYWEREIKRHIEPTQYEKLKGAVEPMTAYFMRLGEAVEQMTRFSAYLNARQNGKGVTEAVSAAKEISVNFNRKGSGMHITWEEAEKLTTKDGKPLNTMQKAAVCALSLIPEYGRHAIMFFNAAVQGLNAMYRLIKKNPKRMAGWLAGYYTIGVLQALLHALADDDDDYLDIPDYTRRNNLLLGYKGAYLKWALPQESRVFYALGDLTVNKFMGREPHKNTFSEVLNMCTDVLPLGGGEGVAAIAPSTMQPIMDIALNKDFTGQRVYNDLRFLSEGAKERTPRYNNALAYTNGFAILISKGLNDVSGGTPYDAGEINIPPEILQHLFEGYGGGSLTTINKTFDTAENLFKAALGEKNEVSVRRFPFLNRVLLLNDERTRDSYVSELFDYYKDEAEHVKTKEKQMIKFNDQDGLDALKKSYDYRLYQLYEKNYRKKIASYTKEIKLEPNVQERKKLIREQEELKKQFLGEISTLDKR